MNSCVYSNTAKSIQRKYVHKYLSTPVYIKIYKCKTTIVVYKYASIFEDIYELLCGKVCIHKPNEMYVTTTSKHQRAQYFSNRNAHLYLNLYHFYIDLKLLFLVV